MSSYVPKVNRKLYNRVSAKKKIPVGLLIDVYSAMWKGVNKIMSSGKTNVIYLRNLGTFCGDKDIARYVTKNKKIGDMRLLKKKEEEDE